MNSLMNEMVPPAASRSTSTIESLPHDLLCDILSRFPLKSVIQYVSVCKSWFSVIRDPSFGNLHFSRSESEPSPLILTHDQIGELNVIGMSYIKLEGRSREISQTAAVNNMISLRSWRLAGTCNGLLCFSTSGREEIAMVCNPVTREHVIPPKPPPSPRSCRVVVAFGLDRISNKYKIVRLFCRRNTVIAAEVHALGGAGSWRKVEVEGIDYAPNGRSVYANGAVHWLVREAEIILSFDLGREEFTTTAYPKRFVDKFAIEKVTTELQILAAVGTLDGFPRMRSATVHKGVLSMCFGVGRGEDCVHRELKMARLSPLLNWDICSIHRASLVSLRHLNADGEDDYGCDVHFVGEPRV